MEQWDESFFSDALRLEKLYRSCMRQAAHDHRLSPNEVEVLLVSASGSSEKSHGKVRALIQGKGCKVVAQRDIRSHQ